MLRIPHCLVNRLTDRGEVVSMPPSGMCCRVGFVRTDFTANVVPSSRVISALNMEATCSSETSLLSRPARHHIPENGTTYSNMSLSLDYKWMPVSCKNQGCRYSGEDPKVQICGHLSEVFQRILTYIC
jgi:hypothetical protein